MTRTRRFFVYSDKQKLEGVRSERWADCQLPVPIEDLYWDALEDLALCGWFPGLESPRRDLVGKSGKTVTGFVFTLTPQGTDRRAYVLASLVEVSSLADYLEGRP